MWLEGQGGREKVGKDKEMEKREKVRERQIESVCHRKWQTEEQTDNRMVKSYRDVIQPK